MHSFFRPDAAAGVHETCELRLPDGTFHATVDNGVLTTGLGAGPNPHLVLIGERSTVLAALRGELATREAVQRGKLKIQGDRKVLGRFLEMFRLAETGTAERTSEAQEANQRS